MPSKKKLFHEDQESIWHHIEDKKKQWAEIEEIAQLTYKDLTKLQDGKSGVEAKNWSDQGRACARCAGYLMVVEELDTGNLVLQCKSCKQYWYLTDLMPWPKEELELEEALANEVGGKLRYYPDELYRKISDSVVYEYTQMRKDYKQGL